MQNLGALLSKKEGIIVTALFAALISVPGASAQT
jgi:hypothetical protein